MTGIRGCSECRHAAPRSRFSPTKHLKSFKAQSFTLRNTPFDYIQVSSFLKDEGRGERERETNKTSPVNRDSLSQEVCAPNPFHFRSVKY